MDRARNGKEGVGISPQPVGPFSFMDHFFPIGEVEWCENARNVENQRFSLIFEGNRL